MCRWEKHEGLQRRGLHARFGRMRGKEEQERKMQMSLTLKSWSPIHRDLPPTAAAVEPRSKSTAAATAKPHHRGRKRRCGQPNWSASQAGASCNLSFVTRHSSLSLHRICTTISKLNYPRPNFPNPNLESLVSGCSRRHIHRKVLCHFSTRIKEIQQSRLPVALNLDFNPEFPR